MGLLDATVNLHEELYPAAIKFARTIKDKKPASEKRLFPWDLIILSLARHRVRKKTFSLYPAPFAIIDGIKSGILGGLTAGLKKDAQNFAALSQGSVGKNLMRLFFLQKERQKNPYGEHVPPVENLGVVGSGLMGTGISFVSLLADLPVQLCDSDETALTRARSFTNKLLEKLVKRGRLSENQKSRALSKLSVSTVQSQFCIGAI